MALFTDGMISAIDDLTAHDSALLAVASTEGIDITKKLKLAQERLGMDLKNVLAKTDRLSNVVVTTPLATWHAFHTLELVYRDAYGNQLNDRYAAKRDQYAAQATWAAQKLLETGVAMVNRPLPKASPPQLSYCAGGQAGNTYYVCVSWVNEEGQEGAAGEWGAIMVPDNNVLSVRPVWSPAGVFGWNVFVGLSPDTICQQNAAPVAVSDAWLQQDAVSTTGHSPGEGQRPDYTRMVARILQRG